ncbi:MAG: hypothetical protein CMH56_16670 [Myxococcales bacterium]|nr:hypothetical protein [Myxococcales bacterium]
MTVPTGSKALEKLVCPIADTSCVQHLPNFFKHFLETTMTTLAATRGEGSLYHFNHGDINNGTQDYKHGETYLDAGVKIAGIEGSYSGAFGTDGDNFVASGKLYGEATLYAIGLEASATTHNGLASAGIHGSFWSGARAGASASITAGADGLHAEANAGGFAGAVFEGGAHAQVGGIGGHAKGRIGWGVAAQADLSVGYKDGKFSFKAGFLVGLGPLLGGEIGFTIDFKKIGRGIKNAAKKGFNALVNGAKAVGSGICKAAKAVGKAAKKAGEAVVDTVKKAGKSIKKKAKKAWKKIKSWFS